MKQVQDLTLRPIDRSVDMAAILAIDTSYTYKSVYQVREAEDAQHLELQVSDTTQIKRYEIDFSEPEWTHGFVAIIDGRICGFIATRIEAWNRRLGIGHFYVDLKYRNLGVGRKLMRIALDLGRSEGAEMAWVETSNLNVPAISFYQRLGFKICGFDTSLYQGTSSRNEIALFLAAPILHILEMQSRGKAR